MNRLKISLFVIALILGVAIVSSLVTSQMNRTADEPAGQKRLTAAELFNAENRLVVESGSAELARADGTKETVKTETSVAAGDAIVVSDDGFAVIYWFDDSVSRLKGGTTMRITVADYAPEDASRTSIDFDVVRGTVWSKVIGLVNGDASFTAQGAGTVAGVRGTIFNITVADDGAIVDAIQHDTFVRMDEQTQDVRPGDTVWLPVKDTPEWKRGMAAVQRMRTDKEKLASDWFMGNGEDDRQDAERIRAKHLALALSTFGDVDLDAVKARLERAVAALAGSPTDEAALRDLRARLMLLERALPAIAVPAVYVPVILTPTTELDTTIGEIRIETKGGGSLTGY